MGKIRDKNLNWTEEAKQASKEIVEIVAPLIEKYRFMGFDYPEIEYLFFDVVNEECLIQRIKEKQQILK